MDKDIIVVGAFHEIIELCESCNYNIVGCIDNIKEGAYFGYSIIGKDSDAPFLYKKYKGVKLVVSPDAPCIRKKIVNFYSRLGFSFESIVSPYARLSKHCTYGEGCVIHAGVNISASVKIGNFVRLNTNCNIMHDSVIESYTTVAPNAVILGAVRVAEACYIGANSTILPNVEIGTRCVVGAGAVATKAVSDCCTVKGVPAR